MRLSLGQATPCHFGIGEDDRRDRIGLESDLVTRNRFHCHASFMGRLMGEHRLADYIADRVDRRIIRLQLLVHLNEATLAYFYTRLL